jgi:hypothetical protein
MSILDKLRNKSESEPVVESKKVTKKPELNQNDLTLDEIAFLLTSIKDSTFKVGDVEIVYSTIIKLQKQFLQLSGTPHSEEINTN